jgi:hypothetical protein
MIVGLTSWLSRMYRYGRTGALVVLSEFALDDSVLPRHLLTVPSIPQACGIADSTDFRPRLAERASRC